ncbi:enoyl-CoA hydratase/isomerase family protein [Peristeroidobacter soli]|uniref:enoyl-CoA hydratase/isomerase family protein n=1 Tax=Peristeroidobacter soli TaxID=2497877 RepID=UPI00101D36C6|nr:enoyl-CoA hydratase/isomerase family protein [Peristeroidobacter soli]
MSLENKRVGQLDLARHGAVTLLTIDRVEKHNALTAEFWGDLRRVLGELEADQQTRAIVLTGAGDKAFCAGGDIAGFASLTTLESKRAYQIDAMNGFAALENCPLPVIAAVNGLALGGGCELTLACDSVLASDRATFGMPEAALGLVPGYGVLRAPHVIGRQMTKLMVMASETLDAQQALQAGLVQRVIPHAELLPKALALAEKVASNSAMAHAVGKRLINRGIERAEFDYSVEALTVLQSSAETQQRVRAFIDRRKK